MTDIVHFVHGNGFPSTCYRQLLNDLGEKFDCRYLDRVGHSVDFPVTENWHYLVQEVINSIKTQTSEPVIGIGHSLGGVLNFFASIEQPSLFKALIMLDSPLLGRTKSLMIRASKALGVIDHITPASQTSKRRKHWKTREEALNYLRSRALFKKFDERCLHDYIDFGMEIDDDGMYLRFSPEIECQIYRTIPDTCYAYEGKLRVPTALIYAANSHLIKPVDVRYMEQKYGIACFKTSGSHMFPLEDPALCASMIIEVVDTLLDIGHEL